ncbi:hypothetical protein HRD49_41540 [Corallococcus exiguus]|uniref:hypothetical protein n=1 Tax=Corallococcus TaxID=83461 RepID=UPI000EA18D6D|nr:MULTISPECIES: hypothetical protein [Corallococcus]NNC22039.1 hypothetical protein [Corallococcus exiguus]NRD68232.1 hypothetical protein [Corallococcus exiguus]RKH25637.1 hypothetical protein D7V77_16980 [Corallococcus sp. CA041A]RKH95449.1 hypothetical protein D7Y15_42130 [Corallococcus sp. AB030]
MNEDGFLRAVPEHGRGVHANDTARTRRLDLTSEASSTAATALGRALTSDGRWTPPVTLEA